MRAKAALKKSIAFLLGICMLAGAVSFCAPVQVEAAGRVLTLEAAKKAAVASSEKIESLEIQIDSKRAAAESAVRSLREKQRNMSTIRWSPLLSIKWPTKPTESEALEFQFKPTQLSYQIRVLEHKIIEERLATYEKVSNLYIDIITAQQELDFCKQRTAALKDAVEKVRARISEGTANRDMLKEAQSRYNDSVSKMTTQRTKLERSKQKMSTLVGFNVASGYTFEDAYVQADMQRDNIPYLQQMALSDDQGVFEAETDEQLALANLRINWTLISGNYSSDVWRIESYVQQALEGQKIGKKSFKKDYDQFLKDVDEPWQGSYKFLFIRIPKEWLKGDLDGIRYVEDDPYVLYQAALDYESARKEAANTRSDLMQAVEDGYDNYASARKAYLDANTEVKLAAEQLARDEVKNLLGELSFEEYDTEAREYESLRTDVNSALAVYCQTLYTLDKTTCGGASEYFWGAAVSGGGAAGAGQSAGIDGEITGTAAGAGRMDNPPEDPLSVNLSDVIQTGPTYTLRPIISSEEFLLSVDIPEDYYAKTGLNITQFALYCDKTQIGERTAVGRTLRHLNLAVEDVTTVAIRVYDGDTFIDECEIDPTVVRGPLEIVVDRTEDTNLNHVIGTFRTQDNMATDTFSIIFAFDQEKIRSDYAAVAEAAFYTVSTAAGTNLGGDELIPVDQNFTYLSFVKNDLKELVLHLYASNQSKIGVAKLYPSTRWIIHEPTTEEEIENQAAQEEAAEEEARKAEEEAAAAEEAAAEAARNAAIALIKRFGLEATDPRITYALNHMNELGYLAGLYEEEIAIDQELVKTQNAATAAAEDFGRNDPVTTALLDRVEVLKARKTTIQNTYLDSAYMELRELR